METQEEGVNPTNDKNEAADFRCLPDGKFIEALSKAQDAFPEIEKNKVNPHFGSKYSDLQSIRKAIVPVLTEHGFSIVHFVNNVDGKMSVETRLFHKDSKSTIATEVPVPVQGGIQGIGSAITYGRRYGLCALLGIVGDDDDDGNEGNKSPAKRTQTRQASRTTSRSNGSGTTSRASNGASNGSSNGSNGSTNGSKEKTATEDLPKGFSEGDNLVIHFGRTLKGQAIGDLPESSLRWLVQDWEPNPQFANEQDKALKEAATRLYKAKFGSKVQADDPPAKDEAEQDPTDEDVPF